MRRSLAALLLVAVIVGYVVWQRPEEPVPPPAPPKPVVLEYADGSRMWSVGEGGLQPMVVQRVLKEMSEVSVPYDSLVARGGAVRTTIDAKAQTTAAAVLGRLVARQQGPDGSYSQEELNAGMTAIDPASGGVRVYLPGFQWDQDLAGGVAQQPSPGLFQPFAGVRDVGEGQVTPLDVTATYATLAAAGVERKPHLVSTVTGADGSLRYKAADTAKPVIGEHVVDRITASLKDNAMCNGVACMPYAAPWMVGYTPQLAVTVYVEKAGAVNAGLPRVIWQEFLAGFAG
ncbi:hypothetical protein [Lentzea aerocolonigenes]|uniref:hypothetical protein n=1 Tax=Lentzea aerocolonigenes TaxID=68170 RepID=UPI000B2DA859|nr:hypothetical protein [Lentzea aerocolonigenes]